MTDSTQEGGQLLCGYRLVDGPCHAPIALNSASYSGYSHVHPADWLHWASPVEYGQGLLETERIFARCEVCGKLPDGNLDHILKKGHRFVAIIPVAV